MLRVEYREGLYLPDLDLWLDADGPRDRCVISHAHSDHIAEHRSIVATPETARIFRHRCGEAEVELLPYGERRDYGRYALTMYPAGHCLGSAQILVEADGERLVYTGDVKLRPNVAAEQAVVVPCDTLVMESTFGDPQYRFPPDVATFDRLYAACDRALSDDAVPVVLGYALGKSQEALELLLRRGYRVTLHGAVWNVCEIYRELGVKFSGKYERYDREHLKGRVLITTPGSRRQPMVLNIPRRLTIMLTGWAVGKSAPYMYKDVDLVLPLSDHADFDDLVRLARESGAERVITMHGPKKFAALLRDLGFNAEHLAQHPSQQTGRATKKAAAAVVERKLFE
ncbi:MAG TPA: MBL fold metallo-hydrolase [Pyrinomonadaceae bacterium]|jgi:Cft2 family RNA processing exonuclease|nr:MBL fold metallo-hydrolase [Pyrinomonadaceae bacterium]